MISCRVFLSSNAIYFRLHTIENSDELYNLLWKYIMLHSYINGFSSDLAKVKTCFIFKLNFKNQWVHSKQYNSTIEVVFFKSDQDKQCFIFKLQWRYTVICWANVKQYKWSPTDKNKWKKTEWLQNNYTNYSKVDNCKLKRRLSLEIKITLTFESDHKKIPWLDRQIRNE